MSAREKAAYNKGYLAGKKNGQNGHAIQTEDSKAVPKSPVEITLQRDNLQITIKES